MSYEKSDLIEMLQLIIYYCFVKAENPKINDHFFVSDGYNLNVTAAFLYILKVIFHFHAQSSLCRIHDFSLPTSKIWEQLHYFLVALCFPIHLKPKSDAANDNTK